MNTYQVNILNPKATKLLQDLADLNLISIKKTTEDDFLKVVNRIRAKAAGDQPSLEEITKEVESVRAKRYAGNIDYLYPICYKQITLMGHDRKNINRK